MMQKPELPNGCEITSLTSVLNYYDYQVSKTNMARWRG
ncbi:C39 family peptidase [Ornithinibacillus sp. JPR2-1]